MNNTPQYSPVGEPQLDRLTGILVLAGMLLSLLTRARKDLEIWLWWVMLLSGWALTQLITAATPNGARGIGYMPALVLFAGLALDAIVHALAWLGGRLRCGAALRSTVQATLQVVLVAGVIVGGAANVKHYVDWQSLPRTRQARYVYLTTAEFPTWRAEIVRRAFTGEGIINVGQWRQLYPIADPANP